MENILYPYFIVLFLNCNIEGTFLDILRLSIISIQMTILLKRSGVMFLKSKNLPFIIIGTSLLICTSIFAAPTLKQIKAYLNPSIQYTLNGKSILTDTTTLSYQNKNYVSIADLANALGLEVGYQNGTVSLTSPQDKVITIPQAIIKEVIPESNQIVILPVDTKDTPTDYLILNVTSETTIQNAYSNLVYTLEDLQEGMTLSVEHSTAMTRSLPPQTVAYTLTVLEETTTPILEEETTTRMLSNMNIISVHTDENYFIVVPEGKDSTDFYDQILIRYSKDTVMTTQSGQELATTFKEGQVVTIKVGPAATLSIPPQMLALEITLEA